MQSILSPQFEQFIREKQYVTNVSLCILKNIASCLQSERPCRNLIGSEKRG